MVMTARGERLSPHYRFMYSVTKMVLKAGCLACCCLSIKSHLFTLQSPSTIKPTVVQNFRQCLGLVSGAD